MYVGSRALPTLLNVTLNTIEVFLFLFFCFCFLEVKLDSGVEFCEKQR